MESLKIIEAIKISEPKGLMLILRNGINGLSEHKKNQYKLNFQKSIGTKELPLMVMASNFPLTDLDLFHQPEKSEYYLKSIIDFIKDLQYQPTKTVTFHLNTLFNQREWTHAGNKIEDKFNYFSKIFNEKIIPRLEKISNYGQNKKVEIKIETTPVPEFGDRKEKDLNLLFNPYPLYSNRNTENIRAVGIGICLDLSHTLTLYQAIKQKIDKNFFEKYKGIFPLDVEYLKNHSLLSEVIKLYPGDVIHLNDGADLFDFDNNTNHQEGLALGQGNITELPEIIKQLKIQPLKIVMEINDLDYSNRINLKESIKYFEKYYVN